MDHNSKWYLCEFRDQRERKTVSLLGRPNSSSSRSGSQADKDAATDVAAVGGSVLEDVASMC